MTRALVNGKIEQLSLIDRISGTNYSNDFLSIGEHPEWGIDPEFNVDIKLTAEELEWWRYIISKQQWINDNTVNADGGYVNLLSYASPEELYEFELAIASWDLEDCVNNTYNVLQSIKARLDELGVEIF